MKLVFIALQTQNEYDFLSIYDGSSSNSPLIINLKGNLGSFEISSTGNFLFLKFKSDETINFDGFLAEIHYGILHIS